MRKPQISLVVIWIAFLTAALVTSGNAQIVSGTLTGRVLDPSGSVVPRASVAATNSGTHLVRSVTTDATGSFTFAALPPGTYELTATAAGFSKQQINGIILRVGETVNWDLTLKVGAVTQQVVVQAAPLKVQSETSSVGQTINEQQMTALPLNGRSYVSLATLGSGNVPAYDGRSSPIGGNTDRPDLAVHISGGRGDGNSYLIDGVESRAYFLGQPGIQLSLDAIQEFRVQKNDFEARYGDSSSIINLVTKSGTNSFHGSAYEYIRNDVFDAANFFDNYFGQPKFSYKQNQFGGSLGGPIVKSKLFFFGNYEGLRVRQSNTGSALIPTPAQMNGDFSSSSTPILNPFTGQPFLGNQIPSNLLSSVVQKFKPYIPQPNANLPGINYVYSPETVRNDNQATGRIDWNISNRDTMFGRYIYFKSYLTSPGLTPLYGTSLPMDGQNVALEETHIFSPTLLNNLKLGFNRSIFLNAPIIGSPSFAAQLGIANLDNGPRANSLPDFSVVGYSTLGGHKVLQGSTDNLFQFTDEVDWSHGRHAISFGADIRRMQIQFLYGLGFNGNYNFDGRYSGNPLADFLLGTAASATAQQGLSTANLRSTDSNLFFQDNLKLTPRLTLNLGIRWEYPSPFNEINGLQGFFDPSQNRMVVRVASSYFPLVMPPSLVNYDPSYRPGLYKPDYNNWAPRFGFAYSLARNTVLRGGYGIFYTQDQGQEIQGELNFPPLVITQTLVGDPTNPPNVLVDQLFPPPASAQIGTISPFTIDPHDRTPMVQQWNLGLQHSFGKSILVEAAYVGSRGTHLDGRFNQNQAFLDSNPAQPTPVSQRRPYQGWGDMLAFNFGDNSFYNGLQVKMEKHYSNGLALLAGYTWAHSIDMTSQGAGGSFHQNTYDRRAEYGSSDFDVRHSFNIGYTYDLPFGQGKRFFNAVGSLGDRFASGWSLNGITTFMTGYYYSITVHGDRANVGGIYTERANEAAGCKDNGNLPHGDRNIQQYFNTGCFVLPAFGTFGNSGRNIVEIPGLNNWDLSLIKNTRISERVNLQIRGEFFNAWNHSQFGAPDVAVNSPTFGRITTALAPREIQLAARLQW